MQLGAKRFGAVIVAHLLATVFAHNPHDDVEALFVSSDEAVTLAVVRGVMYRSADLGKEWEASHSGLPYPLEQGLSCSFASIENDREKPIYLLCPTSYNQGFMWRSDSQGKTWTILAANGVEGADTSSMWKGTVAPRIAISGHDADTVMIIGKNRLLRSSNGGHDFDVVHLAITAGDSVSIVASKGANMYAGTSMGAIFHSSDAGITWHPPRGHSLKERITSLQVLDDNQLLVASAAGVFKWAMDEDKVVELMAKKQIAQHSGWWGEPIARAVTLNGKVRYVVSTDDHFLISDNGGSTWAKHGVEAGLHSSHHQSDELGKPTISYLVVPNSNRSRLVAGGYTGVSMSRSGESWVKMDSISPLITGMFVSEHAGALQTSVCTYTAGCFVANDSSPEFVRYKVPSSQEPGMIAQRYMIMAAAPDGSGIMFFQSDEAGLQRSGDGGQTFENITKGVSRGVAHSIIFSPRFSHDNTVFVTGNALGGLLRSGDRGKSFEKVPIIVDGKMVTFEQWGTYIKLAVPSTNLNLMVIHYRSDDDVDSKMVKESWDTIPNAKSWIAVSRDQGKSFERVTNVIRSWKDVQVYEKPGHNPSILALHVTTESDDPKELVSKEQAMHELMLMANINKGGKFVPVSGPSMGLGPYGLASHGGWIIGSYENGGVITGTLNMSTATLVEKHEVRDPNHMPWSVQTNVPPDDHMRGIGKMVRFSPRFETDNTIYATNHFSVLVSKDKGATWKPLYRLRHTISGAGYTLLDNCKTARNTARPAMVNYNNDRLRDDGAYCVECEPGYTRSNVGLCAKAGSKKSVRMNSLQPEP